MKTVIIMFLTMTGVSAMANNYCIINDPDIGYMKVNGTTSDQALEKAIKECFNKKQALYKKNNKKIKYSVLRSFIDDCANPVCN